jgi:renalase
MSNSCVIVGAGISGLLAARELQSTGCTVTVLDKGRGVGGRMATRRVGGASFDHGAQFFTVRSERFQDLVSGWLEAGVAREWTRGFAGASGEINEDGHPRYRGSEGMTSIPKYLARGLDVRTGERAARVERREGGWEVACESGARFGGSALLLTAPVPQSLALVSLGNFELPGEIQRQLEAVSYDPCLALMARLDGPVAVPEPGGMQIKGEPLDWISDNYRKGISQQPALTIHAGPEWSRKHYDEDEAGITGSLLSLAGERLDLDLAERVLETSLARWRYSWISTPHPESYLLASGDPPLLFAGDAFGPGKVEGAALSGLAAADHLLGREA